jgi:hypothetical protein
MQTRKSRNAAIYFCSLETFKLNMLTASLTVFDPTAVIAGSTCRSAAVFRRGDMCYPWGRKHRDGQELRFRTIKV